MKPQHPLALRLALGVRPDLDEQLRAWRRAGVSWRAIAALLHQESDGVISVSDVTVAAWARALDAEAVAS